MEHSDESLQPDESLIPENEFTGIARDPDKTRKPHELFAEALESAAKEAPGGSYEVVREVVRVSANPGRIDEYRVVIKG